MYLIIFQWVMIKHVHFGGFVEKIDEFYYKLNPLSMIIFSRKLHTGPSDRAGCSKKGEGVYNLRLFYLTINSY